VVKLIVILTESFQLGVKSIVTMINSTNSDWSDYFLRQKKPIQVQVKKSETKSSAAV